MGLMFLLIAALYFLVLVVTTRWAYRGKLRSGATQKQAKRFATVVFALLFLPVFWDWTPTKIAYHFYCNTQAGVIQYKTLAQWQAENPGVYETLRPYTDENRAERDKRQSRLYIMRDGKKVAPLVINQRFSIYSSISALPLNIKKSESEFIDEETKEVIIKHLAFRAGQDQSEYRFWLNENYCDFDRDKYFSIIDEFKSKK